MNGGVGMLYNGLGEEEDFGEGGSYVPVCLSVCCLLSGRFGGSELWSCGVAYLSCQSFGSWWWVTLTAVGSETAGL